MERTKLWREGDKVNQKPPTIPIPNMRTDVDFHQLLEKIIMDSKDMWMEEGANAERERLRAAVKGKARCHDCAIVNLLDPYGVVEKL